MRRNNVNLGEAEKRIFILVRESEKELVNNF
jgi:hypothetical protein